MITIAICLVYYGIALWVYQVSIWLGEGHWPPFPVLRVWQSFLPPPALDSALLEGLVLWLLSWPLSLALILTGLAMLGAIHGWRRFWAARRRRVHRKWLAEQCLRLGYRPWNIGRAVAELEQAGAGEAAAGRRQQRLG